MMQQDLVMSERIEAAEAAISAHLVAQYPAFAGKARVPRPALVAEALAYALKAPPTPDRLALYLEQFGEDRARKRGGSFLTNPALTATMHALYAVLVPQVKAGTREWAALHNQHGAANARAVYYVALRTMADALGGEGEGG